MIAPGSYQQLTAHVSQCMASGRLADGEASLQAITRLNPNEHYAWALLARIAVERGEAEIAVDLIQRALDLQRKNSDYLNLLGVAYGELGRYDDALAALRRSLRERPASAEAHYNVGKVLEKRGDLRGARDSFLRAATIDPSYPGARYMHTRALLRLGELHSAEKVLKVALADDPADPWLIVQYATVLGGTCGHDAAIAWLGSAAGRLPKQAMVRRAYAYALLAAGRFGEGWREYLARDLGNGVPRDEFPAPFACELGGSTVTLRPEQGLGDIIFFLRFVPLLLKRDATASMRAPRKLASLLSRSGLFPDMEESASATASPVNDRDGVLLGDLPYMLGADAAPSIALVPLQRRVDVWRRRLAEFGPPPYVGITWRGGTDFRQEREFGRSIQALFKEIDASILGQALEGLAGTFVSVQRRPLPGEAEALAQASRRPVHDASDMNDDLEDALALLDVLDEYVCVSNTNTHLRAALGKTAKVLVPFPPEWRWMAEGSESVWFPGFGVYRQTPERSWKIALTQMAADLRGPGDLAARPPSSDR